jgi:hypothetical protein
VEQYGKKGYELEAMQPPDIQIILRGSIDSKIDIAAFNHEVRMEKKDAAHLDVVRRAVQVQLQSVNFEEM